MSAPGNGLLLSALTIVFTVSTGYAIGRIHQWYRASLERDLAYREGYDTATRSLFSVAARLVRPRRVERGAVRGTATVSPAAFGAGAGQVGGGGQVAGGGQAAGGGTWAASARTVVDPGGRHKLLEELAHVPACRPPSDPLADGADPIEAGRHPEQGSRRQIPVNASHLMRRR